MSTIVVIESDLAMRTLIFEWLAAAGHRVQAVATIKSVQRCDAKLVIVGIFNMRLRAEQAVREVRAWCPSSEIIGLSTQLARSLAHESALVRSLGVRRLIAKPCTQDELLAAVADVVGATG